MTDRSKLFGRGVFPIEDNKRTAIMYKWNNKVILCHKLVERNDREGKDGAVLVIAGAFGSSISIQISDEFGIGPQRWIVNMHDKTGKITSYMFADYIQKGDY